MIKFYAVARSTGVWGGRKLAARGGCYYSVLIWVKLQITNFRAANAVEERVVESKPLQRMWIIFVHAAQ